ncbi:restriction system-associated AAA family ATPase [Spirosoma sp. KCTC 42546]|uniref:restriction system-associated AAA family ATPase n=1 Tax=Spirosoma sp. KCTC 42546 TaxID=2520506 RepID=UPI001158E051|nr:restriction system-associated AAA family ATPase [Spirosoma sp. KCTC 42546]QDK79686.1 restriction system-associated AAA family ATPase [Spirosoma sp. KCTC 42546]
MKLLRLHLLSPFRGLPSGFNVTFYAPTTGGLLANGLEPICLVGLNGSGKSNLLEVIAELFYYLENYQRAADKLASNPTTQTHYDPKLRAQFQENIIQERDSDNALEAGLEEYKTSFGFIVEYAFDPATWAVVLEDALRRSEDWIRSRFDSSYVQLSFTDSLNAQQRINPKLHIRKNPGELPSWDVLEHHHESTSPVFQTPFMPLPRHVVGYSSGLNELLSNPFIRMNMHYVDENLFDDKKSEQVSSLVNLALNRLLFIDYDSNKAVVLSNYLFPFKEYSISQNQREAYPRLATLNQLLNVNFLESFRITLRIPARISLNNNLDRVVQKLRRCATLSNEKILEDGRTEIRMDFKLDAPPETAADFLADYTDAVRQAFRDHFGEPSELFQGLYLLQLLNVRLYSDVLRERVKNLQSGDNLSDLLPKYEEQQLLFSIGDIAFRKTGVAKPVYYQQLSDGEHQLLHVMGSLMLLNAPGTLFLFDEPETHFNPEWRSRFVSLLNEVVHDPEWDYYDSEEASDSYNYDKFEPEHPQREQEVLLTTHSPFIISDCKPDKVLLFKRGQQEPKRPDFNTFGASINQITLKVFGKRETISGMVMDRLNVLEQEVREGRKTIAEVRHLTDQFGDSVEKMLFLRFLDELENPID